jgi:hypothetical protein
MKSYGYFSYIELAPNIIKALDGARNGFGDCACGTHNARNGYWIHFECLKDVIRGLSGGLRG